MTVVTTNNQHYSDIAAAIRGKNGSQTQYTPAQMSQAITNIPSGGGGGDFKSVLERTTTNPTLPSDLTEIGKYAFYYYNALVSLSIPNTVTDIDEYAFRYCSKLNLTSLPNNLQNIGDYAFANCTTLVLNVPLPNTVTTIEPYAFDGCVKLNLTSLSNNLNVINNYTFRNCKQLALTSLPNSVTSIGKYAFYNCQQLALTSLPSSLTNIDAQAFYGCVYLNLGSLPNTITNIGQYCFNNCTNLCDDFTIPCNPVIGTGAFSACYSLQSITIGAVGKPMSDSKIGEAFPDCSNIYDITIYTEGGVDLNNAPFGAENASITYIEA